LGSGFSALITDTVGFIRKLPHHLVASFRSTLEEAREADVLLHVIDASHPDWEEQHVVVNDVLAGLGLEDAERILVFNKVDRLTHAEEEGMRERIRALDPRPAVFVSAHQPESLEALRETLKARMRARLAHVVVRFSAADGETLAVLHREGEVLDRAEEEGALAVTVRLPHAVLGRLAGHPGVEVGEVK
jgi:GTP-binding protein HflX